MTDELNGYLGDEEYMPPDGSVLFAYVQARHKWETVLGEWIDNAIDAEAQTITIDFASDGILITDDGTGCADPRNMVKLGGHAKHRSTKLGRYGIGGKEAALWTGGLDSIIGITTTHQGRRFTFSVQWRRYAEKWGVRPPTSRPAEPHEIGTVIRITPLHRKPPHGGEWQELLEELGYLFSPAIKVGRQIKFRRFGSRKGWQPLVRWELPPLRDIVDERITVNGRNARVYCGIVDGPNPRNGFTYLHAWRVIEKASANGCGPYGSAHICGFVELDASWPLTKNKDAISKDREDLYAEVQRVCEPTLRKADTIGREIQSEIFETEVSAALNALLGAAHRVKAKRAAGATTGRKISNGRGGPHRQAKNEQPGNRFTGRRTIGYRIQSVRLGRPDRVGEVKPPIVNLNLDNPWVEANWRVNSDAVVGLAASLIVAEHVSRGDEAQPLLKGLADGAQFTELLGTLLAGVTTTPQLKVVEAS